MIISSLKNRLKSLEKDSNARMRAWVEAIYGPVFDRFAASLTDEELNYKELALSGAQPVVKEDPIMDWKIETKLYQAFESLNVAVPAEILANLVAVEKELGLSTTGSAAPLDRVNKVVAFLKGA